MIIYITQKQLIDKHGQPLDALESKYIDYFLAHKIFPENAVFVPVANSPKHIAKLTETIVPQWVIFTGGNNVKPENVELTETVDDLCPLRDEVERYLINYADNNNIPKLAICRGFQYLNVHYGGGLSYFLPGHSALRQHRCLYEHAGHRVNSYHQHGIYLRQLSAKLKMIACSDEENQVVEAYTNASDDISPTLGVQWHPERDDLKPDLFKMIWEKFLNESSYFSRRNG